MYVWQLISALQGYPKDAIVTYRHMSNSYIDVEEIHDEVSYIHDFKSKTLNNNPVHIIVLEGGENK